MNITRGPGLKVLRTKNLFFCREQEEAHPMAMELSYGGASRRPPSHIPCVGVARCLPWSRRRLLLLPPVLGGGTGRGRALMLFVFFFRPRRRQEGVCITLCRRSPLPLSAAALRRLSPPPLSAAALCRRFPPSISAVCSSVSAAAGLFLRSLPPLSAAAF